MKPGCKERQDELSLALSEREEFVPALREHLEVCAECRSFVDRLTRSFEVLGSLQRLSAPADLDGRVVASLGAGFREDRTVENLRALPKLGAPQELEQKLSGSTQVAKALEARIAQELAHPEEFIGERLARVAQRYAAPEELELRVAEELARGRARRLRVPLRLVSGIALAAAASLLLLLGSGLLDPARPSLDSISFQVREVDSAAELTPMARLLLGGVTGGASEVREF